MKNVYKQKRQEGFTIIEVLIVLAIAALILLIVFLAVPSLQRSSRNNGRQSDVARLAATTNSWISNNNGAVPAQGTAAGPILNEAGTMGQYPSLTAAGCDGTDNVQQFCIVAQTATPLTSYPITAAGLNDIRLITGAACAATGGDTVQGTARQMAIQYVAEGGGANVAHCVNV